MDIIEKMKQQIRSRRNCCVCMRRVWLWQQSEISFSPMHKDCHQKLITDTLSKKPELRIMYAAEIADFESYAKTELKAGIDV